MVFFPVGAGDPCENCLHCLTEMGIGIKFNSVVSVVPCTVFYKGIDDGIDDEDEDPAEKKAWNNFVQSIRSKLTVKSVVDGVRSGAECSFDYLLLVLTADMIAAVGLVESNSVNIVAAMLVSPLMSPIMAATFGFAIADKKLQKIGIRSEIIGLFISLIFGFIFGLLVGTTEDPWGTGDWPTEEMKARGMARSLWIGILWALPSGTGVALALLQGSAGPLIGVAISASLLPPAVNCGIMWGMACIVLIYGDIKIPYLKGENYTLPSAYKTVYTSKDRYPSELAIMGIISFCLTLINICCIFITAVVVLKIKEVAAPYTSSPDLRRFWEHDIRVARDTNRATMTHGHDKRSSDKDQAMNELSSVPPDELEYTLEAAIREAVDDDTFRKVNRCSYSTNPADVSHMYGFGSGRSHRTSGVNAGGTSPLSDPNTLDQVIQALLDFQSQQSSAPQQTTLSRFRQLSRSLRHGSTRSAGQRSAHSSFRRPQHNVHVPHDAPGCLQTVASDSNSGLPTILESNNLLKNSGITRSLSFSVPGARNVLNSLSGAQHRLGVSAGPSGDRGRSREKSERISLTMNPEH
ncbi:uncharacterized protein [Periplaneta americana]|uniref:uncharacterized protein n=1 Tax=Periplaneta americana TaxID=6978 RepID=UPI0037E80A43